MPTEARGVGSPGVQDPGGCGQPDMNAGSHTLVLCSSGESSLPPSHLFGPPC